MLLKQERLSGIWSRYHESVLDTDEEIDWGEDAGGEVY